MCQRITCRRRHVAPPRTGGRGTADGVAAVGPGNLSATLAGDRGLFGHGPGEGASPEDLLDSWRGHGVEVDPAGGQLPGSGMEQAGGRSAPGEVGGLRLDSFRGDTLLAQDGAWRFPAGEGGQQMLAGDRLAPVLRTAAAVVAAANRAGAEYQGTGWRARQRRLR
jgi:hypothetical protein